MQDKFVLKTIKKVAAISTGIAMLGATLTGAMALDLKEYPAPFVKDGAYNDANLFVVGKDANAADTLAALDVAANLQFESKTKVATFGSSVTVEGGKNEKVALGKGLSNTTFFDTELDDADVSTLFDGTISFGTSSYDTSEAFQMADRNDPTVQTSLTGGEDDFKTNVFVTSSRSKMVYRYKFDKTINISTASTTSPVTIDFLGKKLKVTGVTDTDTFTAYVGDEHYMLVGDSVTVSGKAVKLTSVSTTAAVVSVDGVTETISSGSSRTVNGVQVTVDSLFSRDKLEESSATLIIGAVSSKTYNDGDAYVGEDETNPNFVWSLASLTASGTSQTLGVKNYFRKTTNSDKPIGVGECYKFPNDYLSVCLDSLTIADSALGEYSIEVDTAADLNQAIGDSSEPALYVHTSVTDGLELRAFTNNINVSTANMTTTERTQSIWLVASKAPSDINASALTGINLLSVFFKHSGGQVKFYGYVVTHHNATDHDITLARVNSGSTKDENMILEYVRGSNLSAVELRWDVNGDTTNDLDNGADDLLMNWNMSGGAFNKLGSTADTEEGPELRWGSGETALGSKDEDHRTRYGSILKNPKSNSAAERVLLQVPADQVYANVVVKGKAAKVTSSGQSYVPAKVAVMSKTHDEVSSPSDYNLILVGGPCANPLVETVFGLTCDGWSYSAGEAVVKLAANGEKVAMLVAGTDALDTRRAGKAVAGYSNYKFEGTEVLVKGATLTDITVEKPAAAAAATA